MLSLSRPGLWPAPVRAVKKVSTFWFGGFVLLRSRKGKRGALALSAILFVGSAAAAELVPPPKTDASGWIVTVSVIGAVTPSFPGSGQVRPYPFPAVAIRRVG
jgi:hypothetical protein